jgi:hypothetical protein
VKTIDNVLDIFMETTLDFEIAVKCEDSIKEICDAYCRVLDKKKKADNIVQSLKNMTRKEQALEIQSKWKDWRVGYSFSTLDGKEMDDKTLRKAMEKELKI